MSTKQKFSLAAWIILVTVGGGSIGLFVQPLWLMFIVSFVGGLIVSPLLVYAMRKKQVHHGIRF